MDKFFFIDNNKPEPLWYGDQRAFDWWMFNGCYPARTKLSGTVGETVDVKCRIEGELVVEKWDVRAAEAPAIGMDEVFDMWVTDTLPNV